MSDAHETFKMNETTYNALLEIHGYLNDGRVFLARERLEYILGIETPENK